MKAARLVAVALALKASVGCDDDLPSPAIVPNADAGRIHWPRFESWTPAPRRIELIRTGVSTSCVVLDNGEVWCWGRNGCGGLGLPTLGSAYEPKRSEVNGITELHVDPRRSCGAWASGVQCWGFCAPGAQLVPAERRFTDFGRFLAIEGEQIYEFDLDSAATTRVRAVAGARIAKRVRCFVSLEAEVYCWGFNADGEVGDGTFEERVLPTRALLAMPVVALGGSAESRCALSDTGRVWCWGDNRYGQAGVDPLSSERVPGPMELPLRDVVAVDGGGSHNCALVDDGSVWCWGSNVGYQLGHGGTNSEDLFVPVQVKDLPTVRAIAAGSDHTCALVGDLDVYCWGRTFDGELGIGIQEGEPTTAVPVIAAWKRD